MLVKSMQQGLRAVQLKSRVLNGMAHSNPAAMGSPTSLSEVGRNAQSQMDRAVRDHPHSAPSGTA